MKLPVLSLLLLLFMSLHAMPKQKVAVMEIVDKSGNLSQETTERATAYFRTVLASTNKFLLISKERQEKAMIKAQKKESYKSCYDKSCQIPLGQALSADTIITGSITFFADVYTISIEMVDLAKEATVKAAKADYDGSEKSLKKAIDNLVSQIVESSQIQENKPAQIAEPEKNQNL